MSSFISGNIFKDFWEQNPELLTITVFAEFKAAKNSSKIMWSIYQVHDFKSIIKKLPVEERIKEVKANFFDCDFDEYTNIIEAYKDLCISDLERAYTGLIFEIEESLKFLKEAPMVMREMGSRVTWAQKAEITLDKCKKMKSSILEQGEKSDNLGGYEESGIEDGSLTDFIKN